jgi:hypothetical protein
MNSLMESEPHLKILALLLFPSIIDYCIMTLLSTDLVSCFERLPLIKLPDYQLILILPSIMD